MPRLQILPNNFNINIEIEALVQSLPSGIGREGKGKIATCANEIWELALSHVEEEFPDERLSIRCRICSKLNQMMREDFRPCIKNILKPMTTPGLRSLCKDSVLYRESNGQRINEYCLEIHAEIASIVKDRPDEAPMVK